MSDLQGCDEVALRRSDVEKIKEYLSMFPDEWAIAERPLGHSKRKKMINVVFRRRTPKGKDPAQLARNVSPELARMLVLTRKLLPDLIECAEEKLKTDGQN